MLVSASTRNLSRLKPALRALFPSEISLTTHSEASISQYVDHALLNLNSEKKEILSITERKAEEISFDEPISIGSNSKICKNAAISSSIIVASSSLCSAQQSNVNVNVKVKELLLKV